MNAGLLYLPVSVLCSVGVAIMLKLARRHNIDVRQAILVNYGVAALLCLALLRPDLGQLAQASGTQLWVLWARWACCCPWSFVSACRTHP